MSEEIEFTSPDGRPIKVTVTTETTIVAQSIQPPVDPEPPIEPPVEPPAGMLNAGVEPWLDIAALQAPGGLRPYPTVTAPNYTIHLDAKDGNDSNNGRNSVQAVRSWQRAHDLISNGVGLQRVLVRDGTDPGAFTWTKPGFADTPDGLIEICPETMHGVTLTAKGANYSVCKFQGCSNIWFHGFQIDGSAAPGGHGIDIERCHTMHVTENEVFDCPYSGISFARADLINVRGCKTYRNASENWGSGISFWQPDRIGPDLPGYRILIHGCASYEQRWISGPTTDTNGIILDDFRNEQNYAGKPSKPYLGATLVANNLAHGNDGYGIKALWAGMAPIHVIHNTAYLNARQDRRNQTWDGNVGPRAAGASVWHGNVSVADSDSGDPHASAMSSNRLSNEVSHDAVRIAHNVLLDKGRRGQHFIERAAPPIDTGINKVGVDPMLADPDNADFTLQPGSPAIGYVPPFKSPFQ